jgi:hypothetical protein
MTNEELKVLTDAIGVLSNYPANYRAKALAGQISNFLNNNRTNRFERQINPNAGVLNAKQIEYTQPKKISLMEAKELNEIENAEGNILATSETKRGRKKNNDNI